jgi:predicted AAA+ superfamily ATPase
MWIPRALEPALLRAVRQRPVVVVTGARQVGKTSLVRRLLPRRYSGI